MSGWDHWWDELAGYVASEVNALQWGRFVVLDYDLVRLQGTGPYAQVSRSAGGFYCEAVSNRVLPASMWPMDESALQARGWLPPDAVTENWWVDRIGSGHDAAQLMLRSLVEGRGCDDPDLVFVTTGTHPPRGGGEPVSPPVGGFGRWGHVA